ncbi:putative dual-specificity kinase [Helianthus annuus]|nr:putative dual-specificity kinase [Helianthus annuus]KAJ0587035.1 putative dual-specificity kinase [Helianthus annuus]KAJ0595628.1 putative dual-specificity kinase [Helianthus annuus]KAJ0756278.1 putative dual-specificity kinase [Helianthus annuus]KAJ0925236.1 putative dual-specificity kinase [Helianthus annuus]
MGAVMHDLRLIHTDLKPEENILLVSPEYIKVPDYNVGTFFLLFRGFI